MNKKKLRLLFKPLTIVNKFKKKDSRLIFFYSNLGFRDNVKAFYDYLIAEGFNEAYKIVVSTNDWEDFEKKAPDNVMFVGNKEGIQYFMQAKYAFYSFGKYPIKPSKKQMVVNLWHGMPLKRIGNMEAGLEKTDYNYFTKIISTSEFFVPVLMKCFNCSEEQVIITGQPRNDEMFRKNDIMDMAVQRGASKTIVWLPTYRNAEKEFPMPILDETQTSLLNDFLKNRNVRLIVKIHPLQQISGSLKKYPYIEFITQDMLKKGKMTVYSLLRASSALITDYSSVYFDYMMLNRPVAFTVDDIEQYNEERGFVFDNPYEYMPGAKITNLKEIEEFIMDIIEGNDKFAEERQKLNEKINLYNDGNSCERVVQSVFRRHG